MKLILSAVVIILLSFYSCSKTKESKLENNLSEEADNDNRLMDFEDVQIFETGNQDILEKQFDYESIHGFGVDFGYGTHLGYRAIGETLEIMQKDLYLNASENSNKVKSILTEKYGTVYNGNYTDENTVVYQRSNRFYSQALYYYKNDDLNKAIVSIETALEIYPIAAYYYHYGVFLMDLKDYENAEKAFFKALSFFDSRNYGYPFFNYKNDKHGRNNDYTFDNNGIPRENYFTFYNLACIYSIRKELEKSLEFLIWAVEWGYPYLDYLFDDADLNNLLTSNGEVREKINNVYQKGFIDEIAGKVVHYGTASHFEEFSFESDNTVMKASDGDGEYTEYGTYAIRNYHIIIDFFQETGLEGVGEGRSIGGFIVYDDYKRYTNKVNGRQLILINEINEKKSWEVNTKKVYLN